MTLDEVQAHIREYIFTNKGREAIFVSATPTETGTENAKAMLGANDPFTCAVMVMAILESCVVLCEHRENFSAEARFVMAKGACARIFELNPDHPAETSITTETRK